MGPKIPARHCCCFCSAPLPLPSDTTQQSLLLHRRAPSSLLGRVSHRVTPPVTKHRRKKFSQAFPRPSLCWKGKITVLYLGPPSLTQTLAERPIQLHSSPTGKIVVIPWSDGVQRTSSRMQNLAQKQKPS